jgi:hypothetical protein
MNKGIWLYLRAKLWCDIYAKDGAEVADEAAEAFDERFPPAAERHYGLSQPEPPAVATEPQQSLADWILDRSKIIYSTDWAVVGLQTYPQQIPIVGIHHELYAAILLHDKKHRTTSEGVE